MDRDKSKKERIFWIDYFKGFLLLCVVIHHVSHSLVFVNYMSNIYMAAFFYLSGYLFKIPDNFLEYFKRKCRTLIIPYCLFCLLGICFSPKLIDVYRGVIDIVVFLKSEVFDFIGGYGTFAVEPLWFIYTLFFVCIIFCLFAYIGSIITALHNEKLCIISRLIYYAFLLLISSLVGYYIFDHDFHFPFHIATMISAFAFFVMGVLVYDIQVILHGIPVVIYNLTIGFLLFCFIIFSFYENNQINFANNALGSTYLSYLIMSISGILAFHLLFKKYTFSEDNLISVCLRLFAKNAILILAIHWWLIEILKRLYPHSFFYESKIALTFIILFVPVLMSPIINNYFPSLVGKKDGKL